MGWHRAVAHFYHGDEEWWINANDERQCRVSSFRPDLNIAQAWEVMEEFIKRESVWVLSWSKHESRPAPYRMIFGNPQGLPWEAFADTAPLAITLAALKAVGATDE